MVRLGAPDDAPALAVLLRDVFAQTYGAAIPAELLVAYTARTFAPARLAAELADPAQPMVLAWEGDTLVGASCMALAAPPVEMTLAAPLEIRRFYVARERHGRGIATALLAASLAVARQQQRDTVWLCVWETNGRALGFYRRHGFQPVGTTIISVDHILFHDIVLARGAAG